MTRAVGVGRARRPAGRADAAAGAARHRHRVSPRRPAARRSTSRSTRSTSATRAWPRRSRPTATPTAPKVQTVEHLLSACAGPRPRQPARRHHRRGSAHPRRLGGVVRVPAAERRHRAAGRAASASCACCSRSRCAKARAPRSKWARLEPYDGYKLGFEIEFDHPAVEPDRPALRVRHGLGQVQARDRARPHLRLHQGRRDDARRAAWRSAAASTTRSSSTTTRCSTATACATTTSSSSTRSSTRSATCTSLGQPLLAAYSAFKSGHALNNKLLRALLADRGGLRDRHLRRRDDGAGRPRRAGAGLVNRVAAAGPAAASSP